MTPEQLEVILEEAQKHGADDDLSATGRSDLMALAHYGKACAKRGVPELAREIRALWAATGDVGFAATLRDALGPWLLKLPNIELGRAAALGTKVKILSLSVVSVPGDKAVIDVRLEIDDR